MFLPDYIIKIMDDLANSGHESYVVGGCVRNALLNIPVNDYDMCASSPAQTTITVLENAGWHVIPTGLKHGTVSVVLPKDPRSPNSQRNLVEITTYRIDGTYSDGRHPDNVEFTRNLKEDLKRRDFTVNSLAFSPESGIVDLFGGQDDLKAGILRAVGDPVKRFQEDALRIMRAIRFSSQLSFTIENETKAAIHSQKELLKHISPERIRTELIKTLTGKGAGRAVLDYIDVIGVFIPELLPMKGFEQNTRYHTLDVLKHTALAIDSVKPVDVLRMTMLLHDSGKPSTYVFDGAGHFPGHHLKSSEITTKVMKRLHFSKSFTQRVETLVLYHDIPTAPTKKSIIKTLSIVEPENFFDLLEVQRADTLAHAPFTHVRLIELKEIELLAHHIIETGEVYSLAQLKISGNDLIAAGINPGPALGKILAALLDLVMEGDTPNNHDCLLAVAVNLEKEIQ